MKIVTPTNILLDQNIIAIYTNVEKFINAIESCEADGFLCVKQEDKTLLNNVLTVDSKNNDSNFFGVFYSVDPFEVDIDILWTVIEGVENYNMVLTAISNDDLFIMDGYASKSLGVDSQYLTTIVDENGEEYDFAEEKEDEYDEEEEDEDDLELIHNCLENWEDESDVS
jgi:hypothetical protein